MTRYIIIKAGAVLVATLVAVAGILYQPDEGERSDAWSIRRRDARIFFPLLYLIWIGAGAALSWSQFAPEPPALLQRLTLPPHRGDGAAYIVLARFAAIAIGLAVLAMILTPIITNTGRLIMTLAQIIARKWIKPGMDKMIAEGSADAIAAAAEAAAAAATAAAAAATADAVAAATTTATATATAATASASNKEWRHWLNRRDAALAKGEPFTEPAPDEAGQPSTRPPAGE